MHRFSTPTRSLALGALLTLGAAAAHAQGTVTMYGLFDASFGKSKSPGGTATTVVDSGNMSTSFYGIKGSEDLGGGLTAMFAMESFFRGDVGGAGRFPGDAYWARSSYVGLSSGAGTVTLGRNTTSLFVNTLIFNAFGDSFGYSPVIRQTFISGGATQVSGDTGWNDSIKYSSPGFGGLSFTAHVAAAETNGGKNYGMSALYFGGPFAAGFAWQSVKKGAPQTTAWQLGGSYSFAPVKLYAQYGNSDNKTIDNTSKLLALGGDWTLGAGKVLLQWSKLSPDVGGDLKTMSVGYDHQLSKRTDVYGVLMNEKKTGVGSGSSYGVGVRHRF
jgi:predicted porin